MQPAGQNSLVRFICCWRLITGSEEIPVPSKIETTSKMAEMTDDFLLSKQSVCGDGKGHHIGDGFPCFFDIDVVSSGRKIGDDNSNTAVTP